MPVHVRERIKMAACTYLWWGLQEDRRQRPQEGPHDRGTERVYRFFQKEGLLQRRCVRAAEVYQGTRMFELLPSGLSALLQAGWWYEATVIDESSRRLLACHFTPSYRAAEVALAVDRAGESRATSRAGGEDAVPGHLQRQQLLCQAPPAAH